MRGLFFIPLTRLVETREARSARPHVTATHASQLRRRRMDAKEDVGQWAFFS